MSTLKKLGFAGGFALLALLIVPSSRADISNQATEITFAQPVQIPGQVLPAGTYWFTVVDGNTGLLNITQIYNADRIRIVAQMATQSIDKTGGFGQVVQEEGAKWPSGKMIMTMAEAGNQQPTTLLDWYYPGRSDGQHFVYATSTQKQLNEEQHETIAVTPGDKITVGSSAAAFE